MTTWRETLSFAGPEARRIHRAAFPCVPLDPDKNIRITFEEEVSECCEKWRGMLAVGCGRLDEDGRGKFVHDVSGYAAAKFCPECGRKL